MIFIDFMEGQIGLHNDLEAELESNKDVSNVHAYDGLVLNDFNA
jgi:hypothetical protein